MLSTMMQSTSLLFFLAPASFLVSMSITFLLLKIRAGKRQGQGFSVKDGEVPPATIGTKLNQTTSGGDRTVYHQYGQSW